MAYEYTEMNVAQAADGGDKSSAFEYSESLAAAGDSKSVLIPDDVKSIAVTAQGADGATATIHTTTDPVSVVKSGTGVTWIAWSFGAVTTAIGAIFAPVTAIKMVQANAGTSKITLRVQ